MTTLTTTAAAAPGRAETRAGRRQAVVDGCRAMLPWLAGVVPFGLTIGVTVGSSGIDRLAGFATGSTLYAGSSQLAAIELLAGGAAPLVIIATVLAINARLVLYSASIAPHWKDTDLRFRLLAGYLLVDPSYAVGMQSYEQRHDRHRHAHYLGAAGVLWIAWQTSIAVGLLVGATLPSGLRLEYVVPLYLTAEVVRAVTTPAHRRAAVAAALVGAVGIGLPLHSGVLVAILAGVAVAALASRSSS